METFDRYPSPETRLFSRQTRQWLFIVAFVWLVLALVLSVLAPNRPVKRASEQGHFFYGSIGSDLSGGIPVKVLKLLPELFPQYLPADAPHDLTAFGFIQQENETLPIGFSVRRQFIDRTALNCGTCHTGTVRETADSEPVIVAGMPAIKLDLHSYFRFLFDVAADEGFTASRVLDALDERDTKGPLDWLIYRIGIPIMKEALLERAQRNQVFFAADYPRFLPGRVNTFDTFKVDQFEPYYRAQGKTLDPDEMFGIVDFPSVWNQRPREGLQLHWDGNQSSVRERNFSAAIGAGTLPHEMDVEALFRVEAWLQDLPPPEYPFEINQTLATQGEGIYQSRCAYCHDFSQPGIGQVEDLAIIGTDPYRVYSYTDFLRRAQQEYTKGYFWSFRNFRNTNGYSSHPLDGIWARAPYLHNGSVPSMWDLLQPEEQRPAAFEVGVDIYDQARMGFDVARLSPSAEGFVTAAGIAYTAGHAVLDTSLKSNSAKGHSGPRYGTDLQDAERRALIEYLKTK